MPTRPNNEGMHFQIFPNPIDEQGQAHRATMYDLGVVIVSWNVRDLLLRCLESVSRAQDSLSVKIVVVDNNSSDGSAEMVRGQFPHVELIHNNENIGFARANNLALSRFQEQANYFLLLNPDTVVEPLTFRSMIDFMDKNPAAGVAGCKVVKPDGTLDWPCKRSYVYPSVLFYRALGLDRLFPRSPRFGRYQLTYLDPNTVHEVDSVVGAFLMIRRECLESIGLMDESFFMFGEDLEWCYRAKARGWKVFYVPVAKILHFKGQSTRKSDHRMIYNWYKGFWKVYRKSVAEKYPLPINAIVFAGFSMMCVVSLVANALRRENKVPSRR